LSSIASTAVANGRFGRAAVVRFEFEAVESSRIVAGGDHHAADGELRFDPSETAGVGVGAEVSVTRKPFPARISATRCANRSERKRRSKPTTALVWVPAIGFAFQ